MGRPTKYEPVFPERARELCERGATDIELADFFDIACSTLYEWKHVHPEFAEAIKVGKECADARVERSLYNRAVGYTYESVKIFMPGGAEAPVYAPYREHVPPETTAAIFWLKNRQPDRWRDKSQHEHTGKDGAPLVPAINVTIGSAEPAPSPEAG